MSGSAFERRSGAPGATGATGATGAGFTGATGPAGIDGLDGARGATGATGAGTTGATGTAGSAGATGFTGPAGLDGLDGRVGSDGFTGATGIQGTTGPTGTAGATGATGPQGIDGLEGDRGFTGATGAVGGTGNTGAAGATGVGTTGATGPTGLDGLDGIQGATGPTATAGIPYTFSTTTTDSDPGSGNLRLDNATQNTATTIRADLTGRLGSDWTAILDTFDDSTSAVKGLIRLIHETDSSKWLTFSVTSLAAPSGYRNISVTNISSSAASPFADGALIRLQFDRTGDAGSTGATGTAGATGSTGPAGLDGVDGAQGAAGATGIGATGATGTQGTVGATGTAGAAGATGSTGPQGVDGLDGGAGATGATGAQGNTGIQGATGTAGTAGATGSTGPQGVDGLDGSPGSTGATGTQGATGTAGTQGATGTAGSAGATGSTGPEGTPGLDGAAGATGTTGPTGAQGATGVGATGQTGPAGMDGLDGQQGATGSTANGIPYTFSTTTADADPGAGILRLSSATENTSTVIRADLLDRFGNDWTTILDIFDASSSNTKGFIRLISETDSSKWLTFSVSAVDSSSGYRNITVANIGSSAASPFTDGAFIRLQFDRTGDMGIPGMDGLPGPAGPAGATGAGTVGATGAQGATGAKVSGQLYLTASGMIPATTNGAAQNKNVSATNVHNYYSLDFDTTTQEFACATVRMPSDWDGGTVTAEFDWTRAGTSVNPCEWALQGVALNDTDTIATAYGTEQVIQDTPTAATTLLLFQSAATPAITIANTPSAGDLVLFRVKRNPASGNDTLEVDAMLIGVMINYSRV